MSAASLLFIGGARTSTWALAAALLGAGLFLRGRRWRAMVACLAWVFGFEVAWQLTTTAVHRGDLAADVASAYQVLVAGGWVVAAQLAGVRADRRLAALTAAVWLVWIVTGFHSNPHSGAGFDASAEALNEGAKTAWGLAYLMPLWRGRRSGIPHDSCDIPHDLARSADRGWRLRYCAAPEAPPASALHPPGETEPRRILADGQSK